MKLQSFDSSPVKNREEKWIKYWKDNDIFKKTLTTREGNDNFVFFDGPPTANGKPGIHHVTSRALKDLVCRYQVMKGKYVRRKAGWDTHGLPVEIEVEKKLGLKNKKQIEDYGIAKFNEECKKSVFQYEELWRKMTERMAYDVDLDDPYITLDNDYIESVWHILDKMFKDNLLYEGHKILPYCPRCGTGLASHEVAQGYENIKTVTAYVKFKLKNKDNEYFIAWTTTPWTLPSNTSLTVNPNYEYALILNKDNGEKYWICKDLIDKTLKEVTENYEIINTVTGKELEFTEYEQLFDVYTADKKSFYVTLADYVTISDGTGIVHTAPAFGEDDYNTSKRYNTAVINPINEEGKFIDGPWKDTLVFDADALILDELKSRNQLLRKQKIEHNYPHCWRCHTPLIYYAKPSWYIEETAFKEKLVDNNKEVNWFPDYVGDKRFGNWLENIVDWALSRNRYWGTPLPIWRCTECDHKESIGSKKELIEKSIENIDENIDLHRPYVDDCHLKCPKCGGKMERYKDVIDVWFDSGSMPFAQYHYPFENKEEFEKLFPADFICEGIDQTRGWFHSLLAISTYLTGKSPYKNVLVNDMVLDKHGKKMSKHKGNTVDPFEMFDKYGADVVRFYTIYASDPWVPTKFDEEGLKEIDSKYIRTIKNIYTFFALYVESEDINIKDLDVKYEDRPLMDKWLISRYNSLLENIENDFKVFEVTRISRQILDFISEDFSNWYIRRSRRRFWLEPSIERDSAFLTTYEILIGLSKIIAPFTPFIAEELYQNLTEGESVHLDYYPNIERDLIDSELENRMNLVREIVSLGRASREKANIKVRQPLNKILVDIKFKNQIEDLIDLIIDELNIKEVSFVEDISQFMLYEIKPNYRTLGPKMGKNINDFKKELDKINPEVLLNNIKNGSVDFNINNENYTLTSEDLDIRVQGKDGFDVETNNDIYVIIDTQITDELLKEGYLRELISKIQQERKKLDLNVSDRIEITLNCDDDVKNVVDSNNSIISNETLAENIIFDEIDAEESDLNGKIIKFKIKKVGGSNE